MDRYMTKQVEQNVNDGIQVMSTVDHCELLSTFLRVWKFRNTMLGKIKFKYKIIIKGRRAGMLA